MQSGLKNGILIAIVGVLILGGIGAYYFGPSTKEMVTIGIARWSDNPEFGRSVDGFKQGLAKNGYKEGENVRFIVKDPQANLDRQREIISSFVADDVDLIFSLTTPGTVIAKEITGKMENPIPVVFSVCTYPVESNLIASLESSKNNLVGTRNYVPFPQQYFVFERLYPDTKSIAVVRRQGEPNSTNQFGEVKILLETRGIRVVDIAAVDLDDMRTKLSDVIGQVDSIYSTCDTLTHSKGGEELIVELALKHKKPSFACNKEGVLKGHLVGNVGDFHAIAQISGEKAALILKGAKPSWLKTESPRDNYIILNQKTADIIELAVPKDILETAKEIVKN